MLQFCYFLKEMLCTEIMCACLFGEIKNLLILDIFLHNGKDNTVMT